MPQAQFNRSLEHLDYSGAKDTLFSDATIILMQETEYDLRLHLVNVLMTLGDNMGMSCSERPDAKEMVLVLEAIRAIWQKVAWHCERMSPDDFKFACNMEHGARTSPDPFGIDLINEFFGLEQTMKNLYDNLRSIVKELVSNMLYGTEVRTHA
jgi:hypothetical protein